MKLSASQQKIVLVVSIFASFVAGLDGFIVNVALPAIERDLGGGFATQQWVVNAYVIALGALMLIAGSLSDMFGRKRVLQIGLIGFGITSVICALAPDATTLVIARGFQGAAGALLVPSSLALIMSAFSGAKQSKAIGTWTAWTVIAPAIGPLIGGFLADSLSWRFVFWVNVVPIIVTLFLMRRLDLQDTHQKHSKLDFKGTILCTLSLLGIVYAFTEEAHYGWQSPIIFLPFIAGIAALVAFLFYERHTKFPMLPLELFKVRNFSVGNIATAAIYGALASSTFLLTIFIQQVGHYSAIAAGLSLLPVTIVMFTLSSYFGGLAGKYGPRFFMGAGPLVMAGGFWLLLGLDESINYLTDLLPGITLFSLGLAMTVAPLTSTVLGAISVERSGIASAVNNAISRVAGLVAVALLGIIVGNQLDIQGFQHAMGWTIAAFAAGGVISILGIKNPSRKKP